MPSAAPPEGGKAACLQGAGRLLRFEDASWGARVGGGRLGQDLGQVAVDPVGFPADLDGDVAAFGDEAVVDGGLLEHGGAVSLQRAVRRTGAAYGPGSRRVGGRWSGQDGKEGGFGGPVAVEERGDHADMAVGE